MKVIGRNNKAELQFFFDTLQEIIQEWWEIVLPELLSINKTDTKFSKKNGKTYITVNEVKEWQEYLEDPNSIFISLIIWTPTKERE